MSYDIEQQESLAAIRGWFEDNAKALIAGVVMVAVVWGGTATWHWYQKREATAAALAYDQFLQSLDAKDKDKAQKSLSSLTQNHGSSAFASLAALAQARADQDTADTTDAKKQLQFVIDKNVTDELATVARVRLAGLLLDEKAYDDGLKVLQKDGPAALAYSVYDRRGDLLFAQGKLNEARAAYTKALDIAAAQNPLRPLIQTKLDALPAAS